VGSGEIVDPQVEVDLLGRCAVGPVGRHVVRCVLHADPRLTVDDDPVKAVRRIDFAAEYPSPEGALGGDVGSVEDDHLVPDPHPATVPRPVAAALTTPADLVKTPGCSDVAAD
jgi:hypothetical protein